MQDVNIRGIDSKLWHAIRLEALRRHMTVAQFVTELWRVYQLATIEDAA